MEQGKPPEVADNTVSRRSILKGAAAGAALLGTQGLLGVAGSGVSDAAAITQVNVEIDEGQNAEPFLWLASDLKKKYGVAPNILGLPFVGQYEKMVAELISRSDTYDLMVFPPQFIGDFVARGFVRPLDPYLHLINPRLADVMPPYREPNLYRHGKWYALPYDGDILMLTYRTDLFNDPTEKKDFQKKYGRPLTVPTTWHEYNEVAAFFNRPPHLYGNGFYGQRGFCYAWWANIFAAYGGHWFDSKMNATINSPAGIKALETLLEQAKYTVPNYLQIGYPQLNSIFLNGSTAMVIQWDDLPLKVEDPSMSKVVGKSGFAPCPQRSYMPYSRIMAVSAFSSKPESAYKMAAYMTLNSRRYVYDPGCGEDPSRYSDLNPAYVKTHLGKPSMPAASGKAYVDAIKACIKAGYPELSIPAAPRYLDTLDLFVNQALAGSLSAKAALDTCASEWDSITSSYGNSQVAAYSDWVQSFHRAGVRY